MRSIFIFLVALCFIVIISFVNADMPQPCAPSNEAKLCNTQTQHCCNGQCIALETNCTLDDRFTQEQWFNVRMNEILATANGKRSL